jgi:hypothetical protein
MRDRNDWLNSERGTTSSNRQADKAPEPDAARTKGPWAGQYPTIIQTAPPIGHSEVGTTNAPLTGQAPNPNSHLARLVEAVQRSRRLGAAPRRHHYLRLVQEERQ